jgi:hypothetical protein
VATVLLTGSVQAVTELLYFRRTLHPGRSSRAPCLIAVAMTVFEEKLRRVLK